MTTQMIVWDGRQWQFRQRAAAGWTDWMPWPFTRLLIRCACCGELSEVPRDAVPIGVATELGDDMVLVPDTGQYVPHQARYEPINDGPPLPRTPRRRRGREGRR